MSKDLGLSENFYILKVWKYQHNLMSVPPKEETKQPTFQNQTVSPGQKSCLNFEEILTDYI